MGIKAVVHTSGTKRNKRMQVCKGNDIHIHSSEIN